MTNPVFITLATTLSFYRQRPVQALFVLIGLVLGCGLYTAVAQINASAKASYAEADQILGASAQWRITDRLNTGVAVEDYIRLRRAGFTQVYPVIEKRLPSANGALISLIATDLLALPLQTADSSGSGENPFSGAGWRGLTQPPFETWVPEETATRLGIVEGEQIRLRDGKSLPPTVIRTQTQQRDQLFMDLGAALSLFETNRASYLAAARLTASERQLIAVEFDNRLEVTNNSEALDLTQLTQSLHTNLTALGLLSFVVGTFIVFNAVHFSLHARRQTLGILTDLGAGKSAVIAAILIEASLWALLGAVLGTLLAQPLSAALMPAVAATLQNIYGASVSSQPVFNADLFWQALLLALSGLLLAMVLPLIRSIDNPAVAGRASNEASAVGGVLSQGERLSVFVGISLLVIAFMAYPLAGTVVQGFALLALVLFAGIALLPGIIVLIVVVGNLGLGHHWMGRWALSDVRFQLPHLRLAMMALLLTLIANIGVTSLVGSFRIALTNWLETRLSADIYVTAGVLEPESISQQSWVQSAHQRIEIDTTFSGRKITIVGVDVDAPDFTATNVIDGAPDAFERWIAGNEAPQTLGSVVTNVDRLNSATSTGEAGGRSAVKVSGEAGSSSGSISNSVASSASASASASAPASNEFASTEKVFANEQLRYLAGIEVGDSFELMTALGERSFEVLGFFHDYGNVNYALHLPTERLLELFPNAKQQGWGLWIADESLATAELGLTELGVEPGSWVSQRDVLAISMAIFDRTFAITRALNTLTLLVAAIAIFASLLAVYQIRRSEYALWRSLGATWPTFFLVSGFPMILMTGVVMFLSLPLGIALSWLLINKINVISFGWTMPVVIDAAPIVFLFTVVATVVLAAFLLASLGQRSAVNGALKELAGE